MNVSVLIMLCTAEHCGFHYLNQFCLYVSNCFVFEIVDPCTDQDGFTRYVSPVWDIHHCRHSAGPAAAQVHTPLWPAWVRLLEDSHSNVNQTVILSPTTGWMIMDYRYFIQTADLGILFRSKIALTVKKTIADWRPWPAVSMYVVTLYRMNPSGDSNDAGIFCGSMYLNGNEYVPVSIFFSTLSLPKGTKYEVQNRWVIAKVRTYYV